MVDFFIEKLKSFDDPEFIFDPIKHKYTYKGNHFISVTQFISRFHKPFDIDYWSKYKADQTGVDQDDLLEEWAKLNQRSNEIGTATHNWIESYFKKEYQQLPNDVDIIDRINKFNVAHVKFLSKLTPVAFEKRIFSRRWKIAGMLDSIFLYVDKGIIIDYKTNKDLTDDNHPKGSFEKLLEPFSSYYKNHVNEYSIQVSLYKLILREVGIDIKACYILYIGPNEEAKMIKCHDFSNVLEEYLNSDESLLIK